MKYCTKCGKELFDEAVICPNCGCMVQENKKNKVEKKDNNEIVHIFSFISNILFAACFCIVIIMLGASRIEVYEGKNNFHLAYFDFSEGISIPLVGIAFLNFVLSIITLVFYFSRVKKRKIEDVLKYISRIIVASSFLAASFFLSLQ